MIKLHDDAGAEMTIKDRERHFHDSLRGELQPSGDPKYTAYRKWYAVGDSGNRWVRAWLRSNAPGRIVLDYACGAGGTTVEIARLHPDRVVGIDISPRSIEIAQRAAKAAGVRADFTVMDAERTSFPDASFDIIVCNGVLHHMDLSRAFPELARILKSDGHVIALEALGHNPLINWYRKRTPYLRSPDEHPLVTADLRLAHLYFEHLEFRYFNLLTLIAAPLWKTPLARPLAVILSTLDRAVLSLPHVQKLAWMAGMRLSQPRKPSV